MKPLTPLDSHHLHAAQGWMELEDHLEASGELEKISPENQGHPDVLDIRWHICAEEKNWEACVDIGLAHMKAAPNCAEAWIHHSFALHELRHTQNAYNHLATVAEKFPAVWTIPYNLACYCSRLGRFDEAQAWFKKAVAIDDEAVQKAGIDDPDLKPLWDSMSTPIWKKSE